jgi:hypothetical protein
VVHVTPADNELTDVVQAVLVEDLLGQSAKRDTPSSISCTSSKAIRLSRPVKRPGARAIDSNTSLALTALSWTPPVTRWNTANSNLTKCSSRSGKSSVELAL